MKNQILDVIVVGAGQSGLSASYYLARQNISHAVFEKGSIGESWRSQRWDSFRLNTANKLNILPGTTYAGKSPDGFDSHTDFANSLTSYVSRYNLPVMEYATVISIKQNVDQGWFDVTVGQNSIKYRFVSRKVIIASGDMNRKKVPFFADRVSPDIKQLHTSEFRNAKDLPGGSVLVVGGGQSGCQVTEDLLDAGKKVYLSTSAVPRIPRRYRGKDIMDWLIEIQFMDVKTADIPDPAMLTMPVPLLSGTGASGHTISLQFLASKGAIIVGKMNSCDGTQAYFENNAARHVHFGDGFSEKVKETIDQYITRSNADAPVRHDDPADRPDPEATCASPISELDLEQHGITSIIWATGFIPDYAYIKMPVSDKKGHLKHENGILSEGLYLLGYHWLRSRKSSLIYGIREDAEFIVNQVINSLQKLQPAKQSVANKPQPENH